MSNLPTTLEELQRDVLQGDLSNNPYLQPNIIPSMDKELKTKSKKVIPGINELITTLNKFKSNFQTYMETCNQRLNDLEASLDEAEEILNRTKDTSSSLDNELDTFNSSCDIIKKDLIDIKNELIDLPLKKS